MSKFTRQTMLHFGSSSDSSSVGVFGSIAPGGPGATYSKVIAIIQSLPAWGSGWKAEVVSPLRPAIQDFNAVDYVFSYGICYLHEMGIPEWDAGTVYYQYSICQYGGIIYQSLTDINLNNTPTPGAYWSVLNYVDLTTNQTVAGVKTFSSFPVTPSSAPTTDYQVANKKYVDDQISALVIPTASSTSSLGLFNDNQVYYNSSAKKIMIIAVSNAGGTNGDMNGYIGATNSPSTLVAYQDGSYRHGGSVTFICPPGWYWKATSNVGSQRIEAWEI